MTAKSHHPNFSGKALRGWKELRGVRTEDLARELGEEYHIVLAWQRGTKKPSLEQFIRLSMLLFCPVKSLTKGNHPFHSFDEMRTSLDFSAPSSCIDFGFCKCGAPAHFLCDKIMIGGKLCSEPLCRNCATVVGTDQHLCPKHAGAKK